MWMFKVVERSHFYFYNRSKLASIYTRRMNTGHVSPRYPRGNVFKYVSRRRPPAPPAPRLSHLFYFKSVRSQSVASFFCDV